MSDLTAIEDLLRRFVESQERFVTEAQAHRETIEAYWVREQERVEEAHQMSLETTAAVIKAQSLMAELNQIQIDRDRRFWKDSPLTGDVQP